VLATPAWLPLFGTGLTVQDALQSGDTALVLEGSGKEALDAVEAWRQQGVVRNVVVVEAPIKTHALVAYWSDFVRRGVASGAPTPSENVLVVRAPSTQAAQQAEAALPALLQLQASMILVPGGGGIGSRVVARELDSVLSRQGMHVRLVVYADAGRDPARWWQNGDDRRAVLDGWLQLLVPALSGYEAGAGS
jgi:hypothetical protein